ncbi:MAG: hypothetical protein DDT25_00995 [Chloroflexi bacterium]|nr:hypothetical protein [Chloroflexota bacterium]
MVRVVNSLNQAIEALVSWLIYPLIAVMVADIVARYFFLRPLIWARDISIWLYAVPFMLTVAHYYRKRLHISCADLVYSFRMTESQQAIIDFFHNLILIAIVGFLFMPSLQAVLWSMRIGEMSAVTVWRPLLWPFRAVIPATLFLLGAQALVGLIEAVGTLVKVDKA